MYIYKFTHNSSGKSYIGQTIQDPNQRRLEHISDSRHTTKEYHFHNAIRKYGIDAFTFDVIAEASTLDELNLLEERFVEQYDSINNGYNIRQPGGNKLHSEDSKKRMSESQTAAHARRRAANGGVETINKKKGYKFKNPHPKKGKESTMWSEEAKLAHKKRMKETSTIRGKTWKLIDGKRVWLPKEASV